MTRKQLVLCLETKAPAQPGERDRPRRGDPAALPAPGVKNRGKDGGEKEGGSDIRAALPRGLRGYPHSDALHPIYVFRNAFLTVFSKKFFDRCEKDIFTGDTSLKDMRKRNRDTRRMPRFYASASVLQLMCTKFGRKHVIGSFQ